MCQTYVLYHDNCPDGFTAWWVAKRAIPEAVGLPVSYGQPIPTIPDGSKVFILDFSFPRLELEALAVRCTVEVHDHHKTAQADLERLPYANFDMNQSGAQLAWARFNNGIPVPELVDYVEDRDLWKWQLPDSREVNANIGSYEKTLENWDFLCNQHPHVHAEQGRAILRYQQQLVNEHIKQATKEMIDGHEVPSVNGTCLMSEIGNVLAQGQPFSAVYVDTPQGRKYSLRSTDAGLDVSEIAKHFGGGGHRNAAGFTRK